MEERQKQSQKGDWSMKRRAMWGTAVLVLGAGLLLSVPQAGVRADDEGPRLAQLRMEQLSDAQKPLAEQVLKVSSLGLAGPYNVMLRSPEMGQHMFDLLGYLRFHTSVPTRLNEFAILIQGRLWTAQIEWIAHYPLAIKAGLSESVAEDLRQGKRPANMKPDEAVVYDFCMELSTKHAVSDPTWKRARAIFTDQQIADLIGVSGTYVTAAMMLNATQAPLPAGKSAPLQPLAGQ
jgi:4-carboxymuconolactone decarboxylase